MTADDERPQILSAEDERDLLCERLRARVTAVLEGVMGPAATVGDAADLMASLAAAAVLADLRVMSGRQLGIMVAAEADRHAHRMVREPAQYTTRELAIGRVRELAAAQRRSGTELHQAVARARAGGARWRQIGAALGISYAAALRQYEGGGVVSVLRPRYPRDPRHHPGA